MSIILNNIINFTTFNNSFIETFNSFFYYPKLFKIYKEFKGNNFSNKNIESYQIFLNYITLTFIIKYYDIVFYNSLILSIV